jgi:hypothetical protein
MSDPHAIRNSRSNSITNILGRSKPITSLLESTTTGGGLKHTAGPNQHTHFRILGRDRLAFASKMPNKARIVAVDAPNRAKAWFNQIKLLMHRQSFSSPSTRARG